MSDLLDIIANMPTMLSGQELIAALSVLPEYDESIRNESQAVRLTALSDIYRLYIPSQMSIEIYSKMYLALLRSIKKKVTQTAVQQKYQNYKAIQNQQYRGLMGGADSFTVIGDSGIGKSSAISRAIDIITGNRVIEIENPYTRIIPILSVQTPFDSSVKGVLLEILRKVDEILGSNYYLYAVKSRATVDNLIGSVSQVAINHIGLLIMDEIQNVVNSKNGKNFVSMLLQLINNSGISLCLVGVPECIPFFEQTFQLSRRLVGLQYSTMPYDIYFETFCKVLFAYQYVENKSEITPEIILWLYEHSAGVLSVVVALIHDAQELSVLTGQEILNLETLNQAYKQRLSLLHGYIQPTIVHNGQTSASKKKIIATKLKNEVGEKIKLNIPKSISELVSQAKNENMDIVSLIKENYIVVEVAI